MNDIWSDLHKRYKQQGWAHKPSLFAETAITYFPDQGKVLELGAGLGQDGQFFAARGYEVVITDLKEEVLAEQYSALSDELKQNIQIQRVDLREELAFPNSTFDIVYAHLSLHYFDYETTVRLFGEISRVLKIGGTFAFLVNSTQDPEFGTGRKVEDNLFLIDGVKKRYFNVDAARSFVRHFDINLLDSLGETYKDRAIDVHNLIRFIGSKRVQHYAMALPYCGAIIERVRDGEKEVLVQTRWKPHTDPIYSGTLEFPAGVLDKPFETVFDALAREIKEETGLTLKAIKEDSRTPLLTTSKDDSILGFRPYCCTQQLKNGKPWIGFVFLCEVEPGEPVAQLSEAKDARWVKVSEVKQLFDNCPGSFFGLGLPAWRYYFSEFKH